jgi:hypothetical protein
MKCGFTITSYEGIISTVFLKIRNIHGLSYKEFPKIGSIDASSSGRNAGCIAYPQQGTSMANKKGKPIVIIISLQKLLDMLS